MVHDHFPFASHRTLAEVAETERLREIKLDGPLGLPPDGRARLRHLLMRSYKALPRDPPRPPDLA